MDSSSQGSIEFTRSSKRNSQGSSNYSTKEWNCELLQSLDNSPNGAHKRNSGPNVNLKIPRNMSVTEEQKEFFKKKIKTTKKTELCKNWDLYGDCFYKETCSFAHGENELRRKPTETNQKYKTKPCKFFIANMYCPFGNRCSYKHVLTERKSISYLQTNKKFANGVLQECIRNTEYEFDKILDEFTNKIFPQL